jgi:hypothetical protein
MAVTADKIRQMELALAEAKGEFERENGKRFEIIMREISPEEKQRILENLTDRHERVLFGLEAPSWGAQRPAKSGGDLECEICHKTGLTKRGLALHMVRKHKGEQAPGEPEGNQPAMFGQEEQGVSSFGRRRQGRGEAAGES